VAARYRHHHQLMRGPESLPGKLLSIWMDSMLYYK
jgi:hypothetical protein